MAVTVGASPFPKFPSASPFGIGNTPSTALAPEVAPVVNQPYVTGSAVKATQGLFISARNGSSGKAVQFSAPSSKPSSSSVQWLRNQGYGASTLPAGTPSTLKQPIPLRASASSMSALAQSGGSSALQDSAHSMAAQPGPFLGNFATHSNPFEDSNPFA